ncbi:MAG: PDZ domain-containing protein, partial [bacterium]|nr:PDZ domain-containing protein [bacterium]
SEEEKKLFPTLNVANPEHEYFIKGIFGTFAVQVPFWFKNMYNAQKCWDVVMAESMRTMLAKEEYKDYKGVIIAGSNHVAYKLGIPFRYTCAEENVKLTTIVPVLLREEEPSGDGDDEMHPMMKMMGGSLAPAVTFSRGIADYVFAVPQPLVRFFPTLGVTIKEKQGKIKVTRVAKKSLAQRSGLVKGDVITAFDGVELKTIQQLRTLLAVKKWGDSVSFKVEKKIELKKPAPPKKAAAPAKKEGGPPKGMGTMPSMGGKSKEKKK